MSREIQLHRCVQGATADVICNMAFGPQKCKDVEGFPNVKRDGLAYPLPPGGSSSSVSYVTDTPTYLPTTATDFSTATGSISTPDGVFIAASFIVTDSKTTTLSTTTESTSSSTTSASFIIYTITVGSSSFPYPDDTCGVESMSLAAPIYCSAITARGFEYLNDIPTTTSNTSPHSTADPN